MTQLVAVALFHRDGFSRGHARRMFGFEAYHWGIIIMPPGNRGQDCQVFEATDASTIDPITFRMKNPTMDWWLRTKEDTDNDDPALGAKLLGRIVIGKLPDGVSSADLRDFFERVPLPVRNMHPQQSCVTWAVGAIRDLQRRGWVEDFELDGFKDLALSYADDRMRGSDSSEPDVKYYGVES